MKTLLEEVTEWMEVQARKHDLGEDYAQETVNAMTPYELLKEISEALERMRPEPTKSEVMYRVSSELGIPIKDIPLSLRSYHEEIMGLPTFDDLLKED